MTRTVALLSSTLILTTALSAQSFAGGTNSLGFGVGVGGFYRAYDSYSAQTPLFMFHYDRGTSVPVGPGVLGIGGYFGFKSLRYLSESYYYTYDLRWTYWMFGLRGTYHWNSWHNNDKLDTYAGVSLGYNVVSFRDRSTYTSYYYNDLYRYNYSSRSALRGGAFVGVKYYFAGGFGVYAEAGPDVSLLTGGLTFKF
ncbi:MAG: hypothetical protein H6595_00060 [Flavobacteriales bacterium]|nr:hypothetical protein [Flavobacteriales bacterium]MCB9165852.1 hypothetical protein [Flavobacteriales bacterium]